MYWEQATHELLSVKALATAGYCILTLLPPFGALVFFTGCISFSLGHHTASTDLPHNLSILNFRQEVWDLQHEKATVESTYKIKSLFLKKFSVILSMTRRTTGGGDAYPAKVSVKTSS